MADQKVIVNEEKLKEKILKKEDKKSFSSEKFKKIEEQVKLSLSKQDTDEALKDITIWALVLGSSDIHFDCYETYVVIRFRIDGVLVDIFKLTHREYKSVFGKNEVCIKFKIKYF